METPLHFACKRGDTEMAKMLLDAKAGGYGLHVRLHVYKSDSALTELHIDS